MKNRWPYRVDGELGRLEFPTYRICQDATTRYDTARDLFTPLGCWERYETTGFKEIALIHGVTEQSYAKTASFINRLRHQAGATSATTLHASAEREGQQVLACLEVTTTEILTREGFDAVGQPLPSRSQWSQATVGQSAARVKKVLDTCDLTADERAEVEGNPVLYECPTETVNVSIDDVVVNHQKQHRSRSAGQEEMDENAGGTRGRKYVHTTVAHVQHQEQASCLTGQSVPAVLRMLLG